MASATTIRDTVTVWDRVLDRLPKGSRLYGGQRFDSTTTTAGNATAGMASEWNAFGGAFWMLPVVELRQESRSSSSSSEGNEQGARSRGKETVLAVHLAAATTTAAAAAANGNDTNEWVQAATEALDLLERLTERVSAAVPPTTLPPVLSRDSNYGPDCDGQELYENSIAQALEALDNGDLQKVVLARKQTMHFGVENFSALDILRRWKYGGHEGGHLFLLRPAGGAPEFFGCSPERLFQIRDGQVSSEALAGTRPRGASPAADEALLRELLSSSKDRQENRMTGRYIESAFRSLASKGWISFEDIEGADNGNGFFVRRLLHLQHICQRYSAKLQGDVEVKYVARALLTSMHPTPAVCGVPLDKSRDFIRAHESVGFDRGFYAGPIGYIGRDSADIVVGIRSGLARRAPEGKGTAISLYAGGGIVPGSTLQGEWAEIGCKLGVISSLFPQSPITLQGAPTPNVAWASAFIEELVRNGVTRFYVCPGSRSTPLVVAIAKAVRSNVGVVQAFSVHDERAAGFRALGYARGANRPAAVITSSGTAVANLYPAVVEAGMDGVPLLVLTADRPYESRNSGANQAIDQVKIFSASYVRWFRDILPPDDDVPVSVALSDAGHAVSIARTTRGPVHLNIQFRENLAPETGPIRNDGRVDSVTTYNGFRFTDSPGFKRWSTSGGRWMKDLSHLGGPSQSDSVLEIARLIGNSKRGIIVVGNLRSSTDESEVENQLLVAEAISDFALSIGFPIFAGVQAASLRYRSLAVVPFAEHLLKSSLVADNLNPDLIFQIGAPLVSTSVPSAIVSALNNNENEVPHVLLHPHLDSERADPNFTVTHKVSTDISQFLKSLLEALEAPGSSWSRGGSALAPLVLLGQKLRSEMANIINDAAQQQTVLAKGSEASLTEPEIVLALAQSFSVDEQERALFLSNSMPIRDAESFLYPFFDSGASCEKQLGPKGCGSNRGASGIDGIISSALGYAEAMEVPTTLLIGDLATLHDINSLHSLANDSTSNTNQSPGRKRHPLTTVIVNNDGGGIFSFLPIAKHGADVSFDEFFGTPTSSFSYQKGAEAFGLPVMQASDLRSFKKMYTDALNSEKHNIVEAIVATRDVNVAVHAQISRSVDSFVNGFLSQDMKYTSPEKLPVKVYSHADAIGDPAPTGERKVLVMLHGWMGDKYDWDEVGMSMTKSLPPNWMILSIDLPGHGGSRLQMSSDAQSLRSALHLDVNCERDTLSVDAMAKSVMFTLSKAYGIEAVDAVVGYSLGGRVALAMKRLSESSSSDTIHALLRADTKMVLVSASPGDLSSEESTNSESADNARTKLDERLSSEIMSCTDTAYLLPNISSEGKLLWSNMLDRWYTAPIWGDLKRNDSVYGDMMAKRISALSSRGRDLSAALTQCSPPRNAKEDWRRCAPQQTLYLAGTLDTKYKTIGKTWSTTQGVHLEELPGVGHALLTEAPCVVADLISTFVMKEHPQDTITSRTTESLPLPSDEGDTEVSVSDTPESDTAVLTQGGARAPPSDTHSGESIASLTFEAFSIDLMDGSQKDKNVFGIGWGEKAEAKESTKVKTRTGFIIQLDSGAGLMEVGIGEVSPLSGLHPESLDNAKEQLLTLKQYLSSAQRGPLPPFEANSILQLAGGLQEFLENLSRDVGIDTFLPSVRSGLEMALLSLASQKVGLPIHQALLRNCKEHTVLSTNPSISLNGLITRGATTWSSLPPTQGKAAISFPSLKVKVGHQELADDAIAITHAFQRSSGMVRADANRAWNDSQAIEFALALDGLDLHAMDRLEFVEEPLVKLTDTIGSWSLEAQVEGLERWYEHSGINYALDESIADLALENSHHLESILAELKSSFSKGRRGCGAFVLKPALLGLELSARIGYFAKKELGIAVVVSSSFDSGVGLAFTAFLATLMESLELSTRSFPHGIGTFSLLDGDTLTPPFASYVNEVGLLNVPSLSRAFYGLSLDEMRDSWVTVPIPPPALTDTSGDRKEDEYEATTATSSSGEEISVVVSLPLPFSAEIANSRFTDLPQHSRWSPWISSVAYQGKETEWTLNVRGIPLKWRATSQLVSDPWLGIQWESVSGLRNRGIVGFVPEKDDGTCQMNVRMTLVTPRILQPLFQGTTLFVEDFLRDKLIKWSLESFRDVVKADLALERGEVELGDALIGSVEGKASAIEATLNVSTAPSPQTDEGGETNERHGFE